MTEERKKFLLDLAKDIGLDVAVLHGLPFIKKRLGKAVTAEDKAVAAEARELFGKGQHEEARKLLTRHAIGWGMYDEQIFDEDLQAVGRSGLATFGQLRDLENWLAADLRRRSKFRNSLTLQETPQKRLEVIAEYARLTNVEREARLTATGKLDEQFDERIWNWLVTNVPGISRATWNAIRTGAASAATAADTTNNNMDAWGQQLQARATGNGRTRWERFVDKLFK